MPLILGFLVGVIAKESIKIGVAILIIVLLLIATGFLQPNQVIQPLVQLARSGPTVAVKVEQIAGYLPYSSLAFIVGIIVGFFKS